MVCKRQRHGLKVRLTEEGKTSKEIWTDPEVRLIVDFMPAYSLGSGLWYNKVYNWSWSSDSWGRALKP